MRQTNRRRQAAGVGIGGFVILMFAASTWIAPRIEADLTSEAERELIAAGVDDATVRFDGRDGTVSGAQATAAVEQLSFLRGARSIRATKTARQFPASTTTTTIAEAEPVRASVTVSRAGVLVLLEGTVGSEADRQALIGEVVSAGFEADDALRISPEIVGADAESLAPLIGPILDGSDDGSITLEDGTVTVTGEAYDPVEAEEIAAALGQVTGAGLDVQSALTTRVLPEEVQILELQKEIDQIFELARAIEGQNPSFDIDENELSAAAEGILDRVTVAMRRYPLPAADIIGHTDSAGSRAVNQVLSEKRAMAVLQYLTANGIDEDRLTAIGKGETEPIADNGDDVGRLMNRRVDFLIKKSGS